MTITPINPYTGPGGPLTRITPFTYRDNSTYLLILKSLDTYVKGLAPQINTILDQVIADNDQTQQEWNTRFDEFMEDLENQIGLLNDASVAALLNSAVSSTRVALQSILSDYAKLVEPNVLWIDPVAGNNSNTGENSAPLATLGEAFRRIEEVAQKADSEWIINLESGVYTERVRPSTFTPFLYRVTIQGPEILSPSLPMVTFTEGSGTSAVGMFFANPYADVTVKYVRFVGYNGSTSSCGILNAYGALTTKNVHAEYCFWGVSSQHGRVTVPDGVFTGNGRLPDTSGNGGAIRSLFQNLHTIGKQNNGTVVGSAIFRDNVSGIFAQESSTGHADYCLFEDNVHGVQLNVNSRINADGSEFYRNANGVNARGNSNANISDNTKFGTGVNRNAQNVVVTGGSQAPTSKAISVDMSYARTEQVFWGNYTQTVYTGSTATRTVMDHTLPGEWWNDTIQVSGTAPKRLGVRMIGSIIGTADIKRINFRVGALVTGFTLTASEDGQFDFQGEIIFASPTRQIGKSRFARHLSETQRVNNATAFVDMSIDQTVKLELSTDNAADTITIEMIELFFG